MNNRKAFTLVELLISLVIIVILIGLLLPSITMVRRMAKETAQKAQFATMDMALEAFKQDYGDYPPSDWQEGVNPPGRDYCGAQKLSESLLGWDLMGFDPNTVWRRDGYTGTAVPGGPGSYDPARVRGTDTLFERRGPYLELATANVFRLGDISAQKPGLFTNYGSFLAPDTFVLCDVFGVRKIADVNTAKIISAGTPILYYKANTASKTIDMTVAINNRIYNYDDNKALLALGKLKASGVSGLLHPLSYVVSGDYPVFYGNQVTYTPGTTYEGNGLGYGIRDAKVTTNPWPYRPDTYILISAGYDGLYGTADDIHNY